MARRGSLSDFWRQDASDDRVRELASVLRGSDSLIGVMGSGVRAVWSTNGESQTWWVRTKQKMGKVKLGKLKFDDYQPVGVLVRPVFSSPEGTPPLPGLEKRLAGIEAEVYGQKRSVWSLLQAMTDEEIALTFGDVLEEVLQSGRGLPKVGEPS